MRVWVIVFALVLACATAALAQDSDSNTTTAAGAPSMANSAQGEQMMDACLANSIGLSGTQVRQFRSQGLSYSDIAMANAIAVKSNTPIKQVVQQYQTTKDWSQVASKYNLSMSDMANVPLVGTMDADTFNRQFLSRYYGISEDQLMQLRSMGFSWGEINLIANAAAKTNQPVQQIASMRSQGMSWSDIAAKYNMSLSSLTSPIMPHTSSMVTATGAGPGPGPCPMPAAAPCPAPCPAPCAAPCPAPCPAPCAAPCPAPAAPCSTGPCGIGTTPPPCPTPCGTGPCSTAPCATCGTPPCGTGPCSGPCAVCPNPCPAPCVPPCPCQNAMYDRAGNVLLTADQANRFYSQGFDWIDVATAANVSRETGIPMSDLLQRTRTGTNWWNIIREYRRRAQARLQSGGLSVRALSGVLAVN